MGLLQTAVLSSSCSTLVVVKVEKIPVEKIIFIEITLPQFTILLKSEHLHSYFSKFSTVSKEQWSYFKISQIAWEEGEGEMGWPKFVNGGYHKGV